MQGRIPLSVVSALALGHIASALAPADPTITAAPVLPRQNNDQFIGWLELSSVWYSQTCDAGLTWYQESKYAQCCPATLASCYAATACVSGSLIYPYSALSTTRTIACTDNYNNKAYSICNTVFIFENTADSSPRTDIVCGESSVNWSYYRSIPASATANPSSSPVPYSIPQVPSTAQVVPQQTGTPAKSGSKAWIAGAVVGPILGLALIGAVVFFFLRSRKNKKNHVSQQGGAAMGQVDHSQPPPGVGGYTDAKPQFAPQAQPYGQPAPDAYAQQGAYSSQQGYAAAPTSPTPHYETPVPFNAPGSPPPQQEYYGSDIKHAHVGVPQNNVAELGGGTSSSAPVAPLAPTHQAAELGGDSSQHGAGVFGGHELPAGNSNPAAHT